MYPYLYMFIGLAKIPVTRIYTCVHIYTCIHIHILKRMYTFTDIHIYICIACMHVCLAENLGMYIYSFVYVYLRIYIHLYTYTSMYVYIYTYIYSMYVCLYICYCEICVPRSRDSRRILIHVMMMVFWVTSGFMRAQTHKVHTPACASAAHTHTHA